VSAERKEEFRKRTKRFAGRVVRLFVALPPRRKEVEVLALQMLRAGTSVAANYREASRARSPADFVSKVEVCAQEADETMLWLELLRDDCGVANAELEGLLCECDELIAIFVTMARNAKGQT